MDLSMLTEYSVLPSCHQEREKWFSTFEDAARYAREIHLVVNRYVHIYTEGHYDHCVRV